MNRLYALVVRNCKLFFKDKGMFLPCLIAPLILIFLFIAFLGDVYRDSIRSVVEGFPIPEAAVESIAGGWLVSSLLAVCTVTTAFTANIVSVQDRVTGVEGDFIVSPVPPHILALSYFIATYLATALVSMVALGAGYVYLAVLGWHLSFLDAFLAIADTLLLVLFGTALSSLICKFVRSSGGVTAVQATVSAAYGFLCEAYMPFASLAVWLQRALMFLPGSYGTSLLHLHLMGGAIESVEGMPAALAEGLRSGFDCTLDFFGSAVPPWICYLVLIGASLLLGGAYILVWRLHRKRMKRRA